MLDIKKLLAKLIEASSLDYNHPVGSTFETVDKDFNPNTVWGGTWELLPEGTIILAGSKSGTYKVGTDTSTGSGYKEYGSNTHVLTVNEMPSHAHPSFQDYDKSNPATGAAGGYLVPHWVAVVGATGRILSNYTYPYRNAGGGQAHSIMQKSIAMYIWIRTA